ncbi:putative uncharacterized protein DDB_G0290521 [Impatiens glandulifera]|uniref:putative uncharacterized protein DDB_G0290521 n=1 Tax=Impatiens glandulifera TaxID=253017 RepID=UPI001FB0F74F|nr:putative uncharacterized protein DDB_G0290521 [Impatiens glandulifera]
MKSFFFIFIFIFFLAISLSVTAVTDVDESPSPSPSPSPDVHHHHEQISAPPPTLGGTVPSAPAAFPWPFRPRQSQSPSPSPNTASPYLLPEKGGSVSTAIPFINSNPVLPLPTGEVDSATIRPYPTSNAHGTKVIVWFMFAVQVGLWCKLM